ncbi:MAG: acetyl-CoA decarbonylase/synthase complex subunit delta [bacterium]
MNNIFDIIKKQYKTPVRQVNINNLIIGGENSLPFMHSETKNISKPVIAIEIFINLPNNYPDILKKYWGDCINNPVIWAKTAVDKGADVLAVRFNIEDKEEISKSQQILKQILENININIPVIILGSNKKDIDIKLLPALIEIMNKKCTIGTLDEDNYKELAPVIKIFEHNIIAKTPIDINLAKQLNILLVESGFDPDRIIIDPSTGALGYGLDYAYSMTERIRLAALEGDNMLNMPIIAFAGEESWKTKEAKSNNVPEEWGDMDTRAIIWECITAASMLIAGANIVVMYHPEAVEYVKKFINVT